MNSIKIQINKTSEYNEKHLSKKKLSKQFNLRKLTEKENESEYEKENLKNYLNQNYIYPRRKGAELYEEENSYKNEPYSQNNNKIRINSENRVELIESLQNLNSKNHFFNDFNIVKRSIEIENKYGRRAG